MEKKKKKKLSFMEIKLLIYLVVLVIASIIMFSLRDKYFIFNGFVNLIILVLGIIFITIIFGTLIENIVIRIIKKIHYE